MLSFFRKYEKTFMLLLLVPALISMGVTGVMMTVLQGDPGSMTVGHMFGEPVSQSQFNQVGGLHQKVTRQTGRDATMEFMARLRAAERAGVHASYEEVIAVLEENFAQSRATQRAQEALFELNREIPDRNSPEYQDRFRQIILTSQADKEFSREEYFEFLEKANLKPKDYETHLGWLLTIQRHDELRRRSATVSADEVYEAYQDERHLRVAEAVVVPAADFAPIASETDEQSPAFVSQEQLDAYYESARGLGYYDSPRKVALDYARLYLDGLKVDEAALEEASREYWSNHPEEFISDVTSETIPFEDLTLERDTIDAQVLPRLRLLRADAIMQDLIARVEAAPADVEWSLEDLVAETNEALGLSEVTVDYGRTGGLLSVEELAEDEGLAGKASAYWFQNTAGEGDVSGVLCNEIAFFVLRTGEVRPARTISKGDLSAEELRRHYCEGTEVEQRKYYDQSKNERYLEQPSYEISWAVARNEDFAKGADDAKAILTWLRGEAKQLDKQGDSLEWRGLKSKKPTVDDPNARQLPDWPLEQREEIETQKLRRDELDDHPVLSEVAVEISTAPERKLVSTVEELPDGSGYFFYRVERDEPQRVRSFDEALEQVIADVRGKRALERARAKAETLRDDLADLEGEALRAKIAEAGLSTTRSEPFDSEAVRTDLIEEGAQLVRATFSSEVDGPFEPVVDDPASDRVLLVRCAERLEAPMDEYTEQYPIIRKRLLDEAQGSAIERGRSDTLLEAKQIPREAVELGVLLRRGAKNLARVQIRQIFLPADKDTINGYLREQAEAHLAKAKADLEAGRSWGLVVNTYSDDVRTTSTQGEMLRTMQELGDPESFGFEFANEVIGLAKGELKIVESKRGLHLVENMGIEQDGRLRIRHVMVTYDPESVPAEIQAKADELSQKALEAAVKRLEAGESFEVVAQETGDRDELFATGGDFDIDFPTDFELAVLAQPTALTPPEGADESWLPEVVSFKAGETTYYALLSVEPEQIRMGQGQFSFTRDVNEVVAVINTDQAKVEQARQKLVSWLADQLETDGGRPGVSTISSELKNLAQIYGLPEGNSAKGGALGQFMVDEAVKDYGLEFVKKISRTADGQLLEGKHDLGIVKSEKGFHLVQVLRQDEVEDAEADYYEVAESLLRGTDWQSEWGGSR